MRVKVKKKIQKYTKEDFQNGVPYGFLYEVKISDPAKHAAALAAIRGNAHAVGVRNFDKVYACYCAIQESQERRHRQYTLP